LGFVGQQRKFQVLTPELFRAVHAVLICYDPAGFYPPYLSFFSSLFFGCCRSSHLLLVLTRFPQLEDPQSLSYLKTTLREVRQFYAMTPKHVLAIVGLQSKLNNRVVDLAAIKEIVATDRVRLLLKNGTTSSYQNDQALYFETLLDSRTGVEQTFTDICRVVFVFFFLLSNSLALFNVTD